MWKKNKLLMIILIITACDMIFMWLPFIRGLMDGATYEWNTWGIISGQGIKGDYWILLLIVMFGLILLYLGWRGARKPFAWFLLIWHLPISLFVVLDIIMNPNDLQFQGETLGIQFPLHLPVALLYAIPAVLVVYWVIKERGLSQKKQKLPWKRTNQRLFVLVLCILPLQFIFLRMGEPHGLTDQIGVILTIVQWIVINLSLYPWSAQPCIHHRNGR